MASPEPEYSPLMASRIRTQKILVSHTLLRSQNIKRTQFNNKTKPKKVKAKWGMVVSPVMPALWWLSQEDHCKVEAILGYTVQACLNSIVRSCLYKKNQAWSCILSILEAEAGELQAQGQFQQFSNSLSPKIYKRGWENNSVQKP